MMLITALTIASAALAQPLPVSTTLDDIAVDENLGGQMPLDTLLRKQDGGLVRLGALLAQGKPVLLTPAYYSCPMLCGLVLKAATDAVDGLDWRPGEEFLTVTFSFDPADTAVTATKKQTATLGHLKTPVSPEAWPFLTGDKDAVQSLLAVMGVRVSKDARGQFAHPAVSVVLTPDGRISRYLYGIDYGAKNLKLALFEASQGKLGSTLERIILRCYSYDPAKRRYALFIMQFMQVGGAGILIVVGGSLAFLWRRERKRSKGQAA